jgi:hypothetical protein
MLRKGCLLLLNLQCTHHMHSAKAQAGKVSTFLPPLFHLQGGLRLTCQD